MPSGKYAFKKLDTASDYSKLRITDIEQNVPFTTKQFSEFIDIFFSICRISKLILKIYIFCSANHLLCFIFLIGFKVYLIINE